VILNSIDLHHVHTSLEFISDCTWRRCKFVNNKSIVRGGLKTENDKHVLKKNTKLQEPRAHQIGMDVGTNGKGSHGQTGNEQMCMVHDHDLPHQLPIAVIA